VRSFLPGTLSTPYLELLRRHQEHILMDLTEKQSETEFRAECYKKWEASLKPVEGYGSRNQE
jgi:hypothetical protein